MKPTLEQIEAAINDINFECSATMPIIHFALRVLKKVMTAKY